MHDLVFLKTSVKPHICQSAMAMAPYSPFFSCPYKLFIVSQSHTCHLLSWSIPLPITSQTLTHSYMQSTQNLIFPSKLALCHLLITSLISSDINQQKNWSERYKEADEKTLKGKETVSEERN